MKAEANNAARSSADSYPFPNSKAIEIPINAETEVMVVTNIKKYAIVFPGVQLRK